VEQEEDRVGLFARRVIAGGRVDPEVAVVSGDGGMTKCRVTAPRAMPGAGVQSPPGTTSRLELALLKPVWNLLLPGSAIRRPSTLNVYW
jgi:hypothetical protein